MYLCDIRDIPGQLSTQYNALDFMGIKLRFLYFIANRRAFFRNDISFHGNGNISHTYSKNHHFIFTILETLLSVVLVVITKGPTQAYYCQLVCCNNIERFAKGNDFARIGVWVKVVSIERTPTVDGVVWWIPAAGCP